jgi:hypothetical protein
MENIQGKWESPKNQSTDQSYFDFRIEAKGGGADHPNQPILVKQLERTGGQKSILVTTIQFLINDLNYLSCKF